MVGSAVHAAGLALRRQLVERALADPGSPLHGVAADSVTVAGGRTTSSERPGAVDTYVSCSPATTWPTPRPRDRGGRRRSTRRTAC